MSECKPSAPSCAYSPCGCIGYGYVPEQQLKSTYCPCDALEQGSLFPELALTMCEYGKICKHSGGSEDE